MVCVLVSRKKEELANKKFFRLLVEDKIKCQILAVNLLIKISSPTSTKSDVLSDYLYPRKDIRRDGEEVEG